MEYLCYFSCDSINITFYSQRGCKKKMTAIPTSLLKQTRIYATQWRNSSSDAEFQRKKQQNSKNLNEWYKTAHPCNVQPVQNTSPRAFSCSILNHVLLMISLQLFRQRQCRDHSSSSHVTKNNSSNFMTLVAKTQDNYLFFFFVSINFSFQWLRFFIGIFIN